MAPALPMKGRPDGRRVPGIRLKSTRSLHVSLTLLPMRLRYLIIAMSGVVVASSACSTDATSPLPLAAPENAGFLKGGVNPPQATDKDSSREDDYTFRIDPRRDNYLAFGDHSLWIPAHSVCDPATSDYGIGTWNLACTPLTTGITISAKVRSASGGLPRVDLQPAIRFNPAHEVILNFFVKGKQAKDAAEMRILYCPTSSTKDCVDESQADQSLQTVLDRPDKRVFRRIKHFSGYLVAERSIALSSPELY